MQMSMFFAAEPPAKIIPSRDCASEWLEAAGNSPSHMLKLLHDIAPAGWSMRTSPEFSAATADETLRDFWEISAASRSPSPMADGVIPGSSPASPRLMDSPTGCLTLNTSEHAASLGLSHSAAVVCSLSDILETGDVPQRYYLTAKACQGILRRAERRGKELPPVLMTALKAVAYG